jgi:hypothetical protein
MVSCAATAKYRGTDRGIDEAASKAPSPAASPDISIGLHPPAADDDDANTNSMTDTQPSAGPLVTGH